MVNERRRDNIVTRAALQLIERRTALKLAAALWLSANNRRVTALPQQRIVVIGGGIIGCAISYYLAKAGAQVTLVERDTLASKASRGTFAWINATWAKQPRHYHHLNQMGLNGWHELERDLGIPIRWGGSLEWFSSRERQTKLAADMEEQARWGEAAQMLSMAEVNALEPNLTVNGDNTFAYSGGDGALDPVIACQRLAASAQQHHATVLEHCEVRSALPNAEGAITLSTSLGDLIADRYVLATGADPLATEALAGVTIPQRFTPGIIVITKPLPRLIHRVIAAPGVHLHQRDDGKLVIGEQGGAPDNAAHSFRLRERPTRFPTKTTGLAHAERMLAITRQYLPAAASAEVDEVLIGWRPMPLDGHPVLGTPSASPASYLAIMHSGITLAPIVGQLVTQELLTQASSPYLDHYRPDRQFSSVERY
jgi:glycine/D-amino acid oxidase-like deaminating enzyme